MLGEWRLMDNVLSRFLVPVCLCLIVGCEPASTPTNEKSTAALPDAASGSDEVSELVKHIMRTLESGELLVTPRPKEWVLSDGWTMEHPRSGVIQRSVLAKQCSAITPYGWRAVPELLNWLDHKKPFIRYIAARSLQIITGVSPEFYYFREPHTSSESAVDWCDDAKAEWKRWYDNVASGCSENTALGTRRTLKKEAADLSPNNENK